MSVAHPALDEVGRNAAHRGADAEAVAQSLKGRPFGPVIWARDIACFTVRQARAMKRPEAPLGLYEPPQHVHQRLRDWHRPEHAASSLRRVRTVRLASGHSYPKVVDGVSAKAPDILQPT